MDFHFCKWICTETNLCGQKYKSETGQIQICVGGNTNTKRDRNTNPKRLHQCILSTTAAATSTCSGYLDSTICLSDCLGWRKKLTQERILIFVSTSMYGFAVCHLHHQLAGKPPLSSQISLMCFSYL